MVARIASAAAACARRLEKRCAVPMGPRRRRCGPWCGATRARSQRPVPWAVWGPTTSRESKSGVQACKLPEPRAGQPQRGRGWRPQRRHSRHVAGRGCGSALCEPLGHPPMRRPWSGCLLYNPGHGSPPPGAHRRRRARALRRASASNVTWPRPALPTQPPSHGPWGAAGSVLYAAGFCVGTAG